MLTNSIHRIYTILILHLGSTEVRGKSSLLKSFTKITLATKEHVTSDRLLCFEIISSSPFYSYFFFFKIFMAARTQFLRALLPPIGMECGLVGELNKN